jgi:Ala-tRNA(Pro) deacylase
MKNIYEILTSLGIVYKKYQHTAVFTVAEAEKVDAEIEGGKTKNLLLRNGNKQKYYLVIVEASRRVDMKMLSAKLGEKRLSFASPDELFAKLGLTPGSVSPFGLLNNDDNDVIVIVDKDLLEYEQLGFHPNKNTESLVISIESFQKFLVWTGNVVKYVDFGDRK